MSLSETQEEVCHTRSEFQHGQTELTTVLQQLVKHCIVMRVRPAHFRTYTDNWLDAESHIVALENASGAKGKKVPAELNLKILHELANRCDTNISPSQIAAGTKIGSKRSATEHNNGSSRKKTKLTNGSASGVHEHSESVEFHDLSAVSEPWMLSSSS